MPVIGAFALSASGGGIIDSSVITNVVTAAKDIMSLMTIQPLGTYITIGVLGSVAALIGTLIMVARGH